MAIRLKKHKKGKEKKGFDKSKIKKILLYLLVSLVLFLTFKKGFLMVLFIVLTFIGKTMRTALGINFVMFDPLVFFAILIIKYMDIMSFFIFLFLTVFLADANAGNLTAGSLLNYVLFNLCPLISYFFLKNASLMVFGMVTAFLYSGLMIPIRIKPLAGDPFQTTAKGITNIIFVYLYIIFLGPVFELIFNYLV
ncbi:hypothetical protein HOD20_08515 [archaeon]|jgi:hypothetical protein|nr:hypothetical protein [archaeon]MBT4648573.1 hypothetical protein [archaeon]MBT6821424.1 hypothetical protein [archaeon]MBT7393019.1 hypothetical protein [archaeon]